MTAWPALAAPSALAVESLIVVPAASAELSPGIKNFGGLSGLEVLDNFTLAAVSDRGWVLRIAKAPPHKVNGFQALGGLPRQRYLKDVESLRLAPDGGWWVVFEGTNRIAWHTPGFAGLTKAPTRILLRHALRGLSGNNTLEAVAALPNGNGLVLAEQTGDAFALLFDARGRALRRLTYRTDMPAVDAVALPDGGLLILVRAPVWPLPPTFATRLEYAAPGWEKRDSFQSRTLFHLNSVLPAENYEGMAVEQLPGIGWRIWLVSDDNFIRLQRTILAWLDLPSACLKPAVRCRLERGTTAPSATAPPPNAPMPRSRPNSAQR